MPAPKWLTTIFSSGAKELAGTLGDKITGIQQAHTGKKELAQALEELVVQRFEKMVDALSVAMQAKERVLVAELQQDDKWTKRARPMVVYTGLIFIFINYVVGPWMAIMFSKEAPEMVAMPTEFWYAWGGICGTWAVGRSLEKMQANGKVGQVAAMITGGKKTKASFLMSD